MKIYKVRIEIRGMYGMENNYKYFINKESAENFVKENDNPWINRNGIKFHTATIEGIIDTEDEKKN